MEPHQCKKPDSFDVKSFEPLGSDPFVLSCIFALNINVSKTYELSFLKDNNKFIIKINKVSKEKIFIHEKNIN